MEKDKKILLSVAKLNKYYGTLHAVENLSFTIEKGEIFGLLGPNGAGKSTTIECILGTESFESGKISLLGKESGKRSNDLFQSIGVQFQDSHYPDLIKVGELCRMTAALYKETSDYTELLRLFSLNDKVKNKVSELSGGEKQKLSLVLALINNPSIVFLDELTTGLDPQSRRDVWSHLNILKEQGLTVILTSHFMDEVGYLCDRILIMKQGKEIISGTPEYIIKNSGCETMEDAYLHFVNKESFNETTVYSI